MPLRLIEMLIPREEREKAEALLEESELVLDFWYDWVSENRASVKIIVAAEKSQSVLDELDDNFSKYKEFRMILSPLEAIVPRPEEEEGKEEKKEEKEEAETAGISREELYEIISNKSKLSRAYLSLISLSAIVATIGVLKNDIAIIIGAMVIAPMVGPNMGLSLSTTLADPDLGKRSLKTNSIGISLAFLISLFVGVFFHAETNAFIVSRTSAGLADIALALVSGAAGAIAFTRDVSTAVIGVMVSIALLPTLVVSGLLLGSGEWFLSGGAMLLFLINLTCINLSGVATFLLEGIQPKSWWEAEKAKRMSTIALTVWIILLTALTIAIIFTQWFL